MRSRVALPVLRLSAWPFRDGYCVTLLCVVIAVMRVALRACWLCCLRGPWYSLCVRVLLIACIAPLRSACRVPVLTHLSWWRAGLTGKVIDAILQEGFEVCRHTVLLPCRSCAFVAASWPARSILRSAARIVL